MWIVEAICSHPDCGEEREVLVVELEEVEAVVCECGCCFVAVAVASRVGPPFTPHSAEKAAQGPVPVPVPVPVGG